MTQLQLIEQLHTIEHNLLSIHQLSLKNGLSPEEAQKMVDPQVATIIADMDTEITRIGTLVGTSPVNADTVSALQAEVAKLRGITGTPAGTGTGTGPFNPPQVP